MSWGPEGPPEEAYSRVTNAERYRMVVDRARALLDELEATYVVRREVGARRHWTGQTCGHGDWPPKDAELVRLVPDGSAAGALNVAFTDFPGVELAVGHFSSLALPDCGCDACDDSPTDLVRDLDEFVAVFVNGQLVEELRRRSASTTIGRSGRDWSRLDRGEWRSMGPLGTTTWAAWPLRGT